jgi:hypothetical protein
MNREEVIAYVWRAIALFGGAGVIAAAVAAYVGKFLADRSLEKHKAALGQETERLRAELGRDAETHKWELRKREILFQKEIEAASEFFELHRKLEPKFRHPDMDWNEAADDVIDGFSDAEDKLIKFIAKHGPVLSQKNRSALDQCKALATNNKFAKHTGEIKEAETAVEEYLKLLNEIESRFVEELRA